MKSFFSRFFLLALMFVATATMASAQGITGTIDGTVSDQGGAILPGASVTATSPALARGTVTVTTDAQGGYRIAGVQAGTYSITVELSGFATEKVTNIVVPVGTTVRITVVLQLAGVEETITVMADSAPVRVKESGLGVPIDNRTIDAIPLKGREFLNLVELVPGVAKRPSSSDQGTTFTVFGERAISNSFLIDGNDANDLWTRGVAEFFVQDAIQEFKVYLAGYPAEFGRASGAVTSIVTRSGTNQLDARGFFFIRDDSLNSSNVEGQEAPALERVEVGGTIGGPIKTDKTFFFDAFQYVKEDRGSNLDQSILTPIVQSGYFSPATGGEPLDAVPQERRITNLFKFDHRFNAKNQVFLTWNLNRRSNNDFQPPAEALFGSPPPGTVTLPSTASDIERNTNSINGRYTTFFSDSSFLESSLRYWKSDYLENADKPASAEQLFPLVFVPNFQIFVSNSSGVGQIDRRQERWQWQEHISYFMDSESTGSHAFKFGIDLDHVAIDHFFTPPQSIIIGNSALDTQYERLGYDISSQVGNNVIVSGSGPDNNRAIGSTNNWAAYGQDSWEPKPGLTLNLGVRFDYASLFDTGGVAWRTGIAWDLKNQGRTIIRAGWGRFYDVSVAEVIAFTPELGGIQLAGQSVQTIPRGASFYRNPALGAFGPLQASSSRILANPTLFEHILPEGYAFTSGGTFLIQRDGKVVTDSTITGKGNPYIIYDVLGINVPDPTLPPVLTYDSIPELTGGRLSPESAVALLNDFFVNPTDAGDQFTFLEQRGDASIVSNRPLAFLFRQLDVEVTRITTLSDDHSLPYTDALNFGIEQALGGDFTIDAEVHIRRSKNLLSRRVVNLLLVPVAASCTGNTVNGPVPCQSEIENIGFLDTNAFTLALQKRFRQNYNFLLSYTFIDATDNFSTLRVPPRGAEISFLFNNFPERDIGRSLNTPKSVLVFSGLYRLPAGFDVSGVLNWQSGSPFNAAGLPFDTDGDNIFDNRLIGTAKGEFAGPDFFNVDLRVAWSLPFGEGNGFTALIEFFNLTNRANPFVVNRTCQDSTGDGLPDLGGCGGNVFGSIVEPFDGREVQIGFKVDF